jgi:non-ribosomal peptide synthetase component E (peptide arylation enzyme)
MGSLDHAPRYSDAQRRHYVEQGLWNDDTLATYLEKWARETPDKPAIVAGERAWPRAT